MNMRRAVPLSILTDDVATCFFLMMLTLVHLQLIGVMSRLLREEGRKSMELSLNVVWCFYHFSHYRDFHPVILNNQVRGITCTTSGCMRGNQIKDEQISQGHLGPKSVQ